MPFTRKRKKPEDEDYADDSPGTSTPKDVEKVKPQSAMDSAIGNMFAKAVNAPRNKDGTGRNIASTHHGFRTYFAFAVKKPRGRKRGKKLGSAELINGWLLES